MLQINDLEKAYGGQLLFSGASFTLHRGERLGVCGRNGHGKTTLFRLLLGTEEPDAGDVQIPKDYRIGHVSQHLDFSKETPLEEACLGLPPAHAEESYRAEKILSGLGFSEDDFHAPLSRFSGGYQIRVNLAKTLVSEPDLLLLDEPTNYLDIVSIRWISRFLKSWKGELMLITHDRAFMDDVCTHSMLIHRQRVRKVEGGTEKLYSQILQEEEIHEKTRQNQERKAKQVGRFVERFRSKNTKAKQVQSKLKMLDRMPVLEKLAALHHLQFDFPWAGFQAKQMLEVQNLAFGFDETLFSQLSFAVEKGDRIGIIGKNGRGKTTLLRVLADELKATAGEAKLHPKLDIGYFGQTNIERLHPKHSVEEEIASASLKTDASSVRAICGVMMFSGDDAKKSISVLSGGERSRVLLGKLLAKPSNMLLLDEPTNHLDVESVESLVDSLEAFEGAVLFVSHTEWILSRLANKLIIFRDGNAEFFDGDYAQFLEKGGWEDEAPASSKKKPSKDERRERAERVQQRSATLKPIKQRSKEIEKAISKLEEREKSLNASLIEASSSNASTDIQKLSIELNQIQTEIATLFDELEALSLKEAELLEDLSD